MSVLVTYNQIRNAVGILTEMMEETYKKGGASEQDIIDRLRKMGKNIGTDFARYWEPGQKGVEAMLLSIYKAVFGTSVAVEEPHDRKSNWTYRDSKVYDVVDQRCPLCKEKRATNIAGCELSMGVVEGIFEAMGEKYPNLQPLKAGQVLESKTRGDVQCKHRYLLARPDRK
ncbi:MAG: hypothetical protein JW839_10775 [Candidatus Lokiarchaeota archaeon]|nr:hypothetical protein [Candidatus Lokiarchaeota archaeon]